MTEGEISKLAGKTILVTGASRGIGRVVAEQLAADGAKVILVARDADLLRHVVSGLLGEGHRAIPVDVSDESAWEEASGIISELGAIHGLVAAAGVVTPIGPIGTWKVSEFISTLEVNLVGTLLAITSCLDSMKEAGGSIVTFSGGGATSPLPRFDAYAASKAAVVRLSENLAVDLQEHGIKVNSVAPGFVITDIHDATLQAGPELVGDSYFDKTKKAVASGGGDPPGPAAELTSYLLSDSSAGITGKLISAIWDPWRDDEFRSRLKTEKDLATLRRIDDQFFAAIPGT